MPTADLVEQLAATAHEHWSRRMRQEGWHRGKRYDGAARTHNALVPFPQLNPVDRRSALRAAEMLIAQAGNQIDYPRGADREFLTEELRRGLPVAWAHGIVLPGRDAAGQSGVVEDWEADEATGLVKVIRVRWNTGKVIAHDPAQRELRRLE